MSQNAPLPDGTYIIATVPGRDLGQPPEKDLRYVFVGEPPDGAGVWNITSEVDNDVVLYTLRKVENSNNASVNQVAIASVGTNDRLAVTTGGAVTKWRIDCLTEENPLVYNCRVKRSDTNTFWYEDGGYISTKGGNGDTFTFTPTPTGPQQARASFPSPTPFGLPSKGRLYVI